MNSEQPNPISASERVVDPGLSGRYRLLDWYFLTPVALVGFALGVWGFLSCYSTLSCHTTSFEDAAFRTLLLIIHVGANFSLGGADPAPLPLVIAQVVLPVVLLAGTISAGVRLILLNLRHDVQLALVRAMRGHTIVCGLGATGLEAVRSLTLQNGKVVAVELDPDGKGSQDAETLGVPVIIGDATLRRVLGAAGVSRARAVVMATGSDARNIEICLSIDESTPASSRPLLLFPEVREGWLLEALTAPRMPVLADGLSLYPFRANEIVARALLRSAVFRTIRASPTTMCFIGFGDLATVILRQAALSVYAAPGTRLRAICHDAMADDLENSTRGAPWRKMVDLTFAQNTFGDAGVDDLAGFYQQLADCPPDIIVVALPGDDLSLQLAMDLRTALDASRRFDTPIFVRARNRLLLSKLLHKLTALPLCPHRLIGFGDLGSVVSPDALLDEQLDAMARAVHSAYMARSSSDSPARLPWSRLPEHYRRSNRAAADHISVKLELAGYTAASGAGPSAVLDDKAIIIMAQAEHHRWRLELMAAGWAQGLERSDTLRSNPLLIPWEELPAAVKEDNIERVRSIPAILEKVGMRLRRVVRLKSDDAMPLDSSFLPLIELDPNSDADCAAAEARFGAGDFAVIMRRVPRLRAERLSDLEEKYPKVAGAAIGWIADRPC
jgi:voltage-gated potassium channel Kch